MKSSVDVGGLWMIEKKGSWLLLGARLLWRLLSP
eukprot:COSAG02_NODE_55201_length_292_cov_0.331606_2_plen_33_part_01